eukprot:TRINITY_DN9911_c0_g1_i1.p1 TRINITY_DN9911_c0_g1~~TRINITY_DN9911_c0_g1_i1.p1  ORF type:complete len:458 (-),score=96.59 TRINITY_DN9911_c0_g1_i1:43-1416(-)
MLNQHSATIISILIVVTLFLTSNVLAQDCDTCNNGAKCCGGEHCCGNGEMCCPKGSQCCNDTCCEMPEETCCPDPKHGGVCCVQETTACCPPSFNHPSRCCPQWFVCCEAGRYGCCDPSTGKPAEDSIAYALFEIPDWSGNTPMYTMELELASGNRKDQTQITGFDDWGELTRVFLYDPKKNLFFLPQANFTAPPHSKDDPMRPITLYAVNPKTGVTTSKIIKGATDKVTGYVYNVNTGNIVMATYTYKNGNKNGYNFYSLNTDTAVATLKSSIVFGDTDNYVGYFHAISDDGNAVYRLGYEDVIHSASPGLGITDISTTTVKTNWINNISTPTGYQWFISLNTYQNGEFISLAPADSELGTNELSVIQWNIHGDTKVIAELGNAHETPYFGPLAEYMAHDKSVYAAVVVHNNFLDSNYDRWSLVNVALPSGKTNVMPIYPFMMAQSDSVSGLGIPL